MVKHSPQTLTSQEKASSGVIYTTAQAGPVLSLPWPEHRLVVHSHLQSRHCFFSVAAEITFVSNFAIPSAPPPRLLPLTVTAPTPTHPTPPTPRFPSSLPSATSMCFSCKESDCALPMDIGTDIDQTQIKSFMSLSLKMRHLSPTLLDHSSRQQKPCSSMQATLSLYSALLLIRAEHCSHLSRDSQV